MSNKITVSCFLLVFLATFRAGAQSPPCYFDELREQATEKTPGLEKIYDQVGLNYSAKASVPVTIPVVIHVVTPPGTPIGSGNNLSEADLDLGLQYLNDIFANAGSFQTENGVDTEISFCLARRTPDNQPSSGINRLESELVNSGTCGIGTDQANDQAIKDLSNWDCTQYLNVWVVTDLYGAAFGCGLAGYAYFPGTPCGLDGIVVQGNDWAALNGAYVIAHEVGHYLGLYHTFQGGCANDDCTVDGDRVCDTPPDGSNSFAPCGTNSCATDTPDLPDDNFNYMDYSTCNPRQFTEGQRVRMANVLMNERSTLVNSSGCVPVAQLDAGLVEIILSNSVCTDSICPTVVVENYGLNEVTSLSINFQLDNGPTQTISWTGSLVSGEEAVVELGCQPISSGDHTLVVTVVMPNQTVDEYSDNDASTAEFTVYAPMSVSTISISPTECISNGAFEVAASGGSPPYRYQLSGEPDDQTTGRFTNLLFGDYMINVMDINGCNTSIALTIPDGCSSTNPSVFVRNGDAAFTGSTCYQLTANQLYQSGSIWYENLVSLNQNFDLSFDIFMGCSDSGADGVAFVFQPISTSVGSFGGGLGYEGINPSLAVEFDTFWNGQESDPTQDHIAMMSNGVVNHGSANNIVGPIITQQLEDCAFHAFNLRWDAPGQTLDVYLDCEQVISYQGDIVNDIFAGDSLVYFGFTGATGGSTNLHQVCFNYVNTINKLLNDTICTGTTVQRSVPSDFASYTWSPSTSINNDAVFNPLFTPTETTTYYVEMVDDCNFVFRDSFTINIVELNIDTVVTTSSTCAGALNAEVILQDIATGLTYSIDGINYQSSNVFTDLSPGIYTAYTRSGDCVTTKVFEIAPEPLDLDDKVVFQLPVTCEGLGVFSVEGVNGTPTYEYQVNNGPWQASGIFPSLTAGNYTYAVRDQLGCEITGDFVIGDFSLIPILQIDASDLLMDCCNEDVFVTVSLADRNNDLAQFSIDGQVFGQERTFADLAPGVYQVTGIDEFGCTSAPLEFRVNDTRSVDVTEQYFLCSGESLEIGGLVYDMAGTYFTSVPLGNCCDSTTTIIVEELPAYERTEEYMLCPGTSLELYGQTVMAATSFVVDLQTINGCDSTINVIVEELPAYERTEEYMLCQGTSLELYGQTVTDATSFIVDLQTIDGCDSTINVIVEELLAYERTEEYMLCQGTSLELYGQTVMAATSFVVDLQTINGCDSTINVIVEELLAYERTEDYTLCTGSSLELYGQAVMAATSFVVDLQTINGCDSIINVIVEELPAYDRTEEYMLCQGTSLELYGQTVTAATSFVVDLQTINGCDSTINVIVNELTAYERTEEYTLCSGTSLEIYGQTVTAATSFVVDLQTINGCDSTINVTVNELPAYERTEEYTLCSGTSLEIYGQTVTAATSFVVDLQTINGCDSNINVMVEELPAYTQVEQYALCTGESLVIYGQTISTVGEYEVNLQATNGCDSTLTLEVREEEGETCDLLAEVYVPNAISPNFDGINDQLTLFGNEYVTEIRSFRVYDRWGGQLFQVNNIPPNEPGSGWDGSKQGEPLGAGVYLYVIEYETAFGGVNMISGDVVLIR